MTRASSASTIVSATELRGAMGRFATGVTVITSRHPDGRPVGTTVSAITSLSLDPPLLLVCLDRKSQTLSAIKEHGSFAVNVLSAHHEHVSNGFARSANHAAWDAVEHDAGLTGSPVLDDAHVTLDCSLDRLSDGGDHEILIGRVVNLHHGDQEHEPLLYYGGRYVSFTDPDQERKRREAEARQAELAEQERAALEAVECQMPTAHGDFRLLAHERSGNDLTAALVFGEPAAHPNPPVYAHTACVLGDVLGSLACDCRARLEAARQAIVEAGAGVLLYTKRSGADTFLCAASDGPDRAVGAGLLARVGLSQAAPKR